MGKRYWEVGTIVKRISRVIYLAKGPKIVHKRHLNQIKSRYIDEENDTPVDVELMEVLFSTFDVPIPRKAPDAKIKKRQSKRKRRDTEKIDITLKRKDIDSVQSKFKRCVWGGYIPYL